MLLYVNLCACLSFLYLDKLFFLNTYISYCTLLLKQSESEDNWYTYNRAECKRPADHDGPFRILVFYMLSIICQLRVCNSAKYKDALLE